VRILIPTLLAALLLVACKEEPVAEVATATETAIEMPSTAPQAPVTTMDPSLPAATTTAPSPAGQRPVPPTTPFPQTQSPDVVDRMPVPELSELMRAGDVVVVDVRYAEQYASGHIPGSISMPLPELAFRASELPRGKLIVAYCT
jgi:hypothetical protein